MGSNSNNLAQPQIPILKGKNYEIWSMKMKSLLEYQGVWDIVSTDSITDQTKDIKALYFIRNGLDDGLDDIVLRQISAAESSKTAWDILKTIYKNNNAAPLPVNLHAVLFVAISAGFVLRLLFGDVPSDSGMPSFVLIEVFAMILLIYVIYKIATIKITNAQFAAMAIGAVLGMIVAISGPLSGASMNPARLAGSSISIYMILGAVLGATSIYVITPPPPPPVPPPPPQQPPTQQPPQQQPPQSSPASPGASRPASPVAAGLPVGASPAASAVAAGLAVGA